MKKFGLIIGALALMLGVSQCRKPNVQSFVGGIDPTTKTITFTVKGDDGAKGIFEQDAGILKYAWESSDVIHIYVQNGGTKFNNGGYAGVLDLVSISGKYSAVFQGTITAEFPENGWIRFVHCGKDVVVREDGGSELVSFGEQDGSLTTVSNKVVAVCDKEIKDGEYEFLNCGLTVQFGVVKFTFSAFEGTDDVTLGGVTCTGLTLNNDGSISLSNGTSVSLRDMENNKTAYYTVLMPKSETTYTFTDGNENAFKTAAIEAGVLYTKAGAPGESVEVELIDIDMLPGEFSVASGKKVYFSKGNLQYLPTGFPGGTGDALFRFADKQWDYLADGVNYGVRLEGYTCRYNSGSPDAPRDLFGWGTACVEGNSVPWNVSRDNTHYGPASGNLNDGAASGENYVPFDWGHRMYPANTWRTLTSSEFEYLFNTRDKKAEYNSEDYYLAGYGDLLLTGGSTVFGVFLLPDDYYLVGDDRPFQSEKNGWTYSEQQVEDYKIVFLPAGGGYRDGEELKSLGLGANYWTSTRADRTNAMFYDYSEEQPYGSKRIGFHTGLSVRLVTDK